MGMGLKGAALLGGLGEGLDRGVRGAIDAYTQLGDFKMRRGWMEGLDPASAPRAFLTSDTGRSVAVTGGGPVTDDPKSWVPGAQAPNTAPSLMQGSPSAPPAGAVDAFMPSYGLPNPSQFKGDDLESMASRAAQNYHRMQRENVMIKDIAPKFYSYKLQAMELATERTPIEKALTQYRAKKDPTALYSLYGVGPETDPNALVATAARDLQTIVSKEAMLNEELQGMVAAAQRLGIPDEAMRNYAALQTWLNDREAQVPSQGTIRSLGPRYRRR